jgi:hypothetical protein
MCVLLGALVLAWIVHAIPVVSITDVPSFARSLMWMSISHHVTGMDSWRDDDAAPPPPPRFGDGRGNFL